MTENTTENTELVSTRREAPVGFVTQTRERGLSPSLVAEQQRAKSEIEAALTVAAARPRDQKESMDRILTSCQRPNLAVRAKYRYARGGTDIEGVTIDLMEVVAQQWGNIEFGFRELSRFPGVGGGPGESVVEAFAWDLETNVKRKVQFTVQHADKTKKGTRVITGGRDIYEWVANQAQRRVRTCLENIIPRDIYEMAGNECEKTMQANVGNIKEAVAKLIPAFAQFKITKEMLEARLQRRIETISAAQVVYLRTIWAGLRDGVSHPEDWFDMSAGESKEPASKPSAADQAKKKMRAILKTSANDKPKPSVPSGDAPAAPPTPPTPPTPPVPPAPPAPPQEPPPEAPPAAEDRESPEPDPEPETPDEPDEPAVLEPVLIHDDIAQLIEEYKYEAEAAETLTGIRELRKHADGNAALKAHPDGLSLVLQMLTEAEEKIRASRAARK